MNVTLTPTHLNVELRTYEKIGGLSGDRSIPRAAITSASVDADPLATIRRRLKVGLRVPRRLFVCWTDRGRHFWAVRRGLPALHVSVAGDGRLQAITVSSPDAARLAHALNGEA
jgi:hypothetical protein